MTKPLVARAEIEQLRAEKDTLTEENSRLQAEASALRERNVDLLYRFEKLKAENSSNEDRILELEEELAGMLENSDDTDIEANLLATFEVLAQTFGYPRFLQLLNEALLRLQRYYG